jgi:hypothetical protein
MNFVFVALCGFSAVQAEIMILEPEFKGNRTFPAGAPGIFRNTEQTFSGNAKQQFIMFPGAAVVGGACRADTGLSLFKSNLLAIFRIFLPGHIYPLFKCIHIDPLFCNNFIRNQ